MNGVFAARRKRSGTDFATTRAAAGRVPFVGKGAAFFDSLRKAGCEAGFSYSFIDDTERGIGASIFPPGPGCIDAAAHPPGRSALG